MLADLLYHLYSYQIFKSVTFRGGMAYLTTYLIINFLMPKLVHAFRRQGITADFKAPQKFKGPYQGATPILGGALLIPAVAVSVLLWAWINSYTLMLLWVMLSFGLVGGWDDWAKVLQKRRVLKGLEKQKSYAEKADGISGKLRLLLEFSAAFLALGGVFWFNGGLDGHLHIPGVPLKSLYPELPMWGIILLGAFIIVGGANAVNLTDGLDTLVSVPLVTTAFFVVSAAYIAGDLEWSERLKLQFMDEEIKEVVIFAIALISACFAFLKFNSPPASIYMGDVGSLGLGAAVCAMFVIIKAELYLPIVGGIFVLAAMSTILQRLWFKFALLKKGRAWAEKHRFFFRAPYHHHQQSLLTYRERPLEIQSLWHRFWKKFGLGRVPEEDQYLRPDQVNNKVIWSSHLRSLLLLVISLIIYFKVR